MSTTLLSEPIRVRRQPAAVGPMRVKTRSGWWFLAPMVAVNALVVIGPCVATVVYSFTNWTGAGPVHFVGLSNYEALVTSAEFRSALVHNLEWTAVFLTVPVALGLLAAFAIDQVPWGKRFFRTAYFVPYIISPVVNAALWSQIYADHFGISALHSISPLGDPTLALWSVAFTNVWAWWGFLAVIFHSAMQGIPKERYEAAELDGAGVLARAKHISLPGIRPTVVFMLLMTVIWSMVVFTYVFIMTSGGPAGASQVVATLLYQDAFASQQVGWAAAMGVVLLLVAAVISGAYVLANRKGRLDVG